MRNSMTMVLAAAALVLPAATARAQEITRHDCGAHDRSSPAPPIAGELDESPPRGLVASWPHDGAVVALAGATWFLTEVNKGGIAPATCRWCTLGRTDARVTASLAWSDTAAAGKVGDVLAFAAMPLGMVGALALAANADGRLSETPTDILVLAETTVVAGVVAQAAKFSVGRERPFVHELPASEKRTTASPADNNVSFYSAHSNTTFALAVGAGTIAHLRGYRSEPYIWAIGLPVASFVAYSRIAAKKHYLSDVLVGAGVGSLFGFGIPWLFHRQSADSKGTTLVVAPTPDGAALAGQF